MIQGPQAMAAAASPAGAALTRSTHIQRPAAARRALGVRRMPLCGNGLVRWPQPTQGGRAMPSASVAPGQMGTASMVSGGLADGWGAFGADQLWPDAMPVIRAKVPAAHSEVACGLKVCAPRDRNASKAPVRNGLNRVPKARSQGRNAAADIGSAFNLINHTQKTTQNVCLSQQAVIDLDAKFRA